MNILLLGSGGREHAFAWKLKQSNLCDALFIAPGNAGTSQFGTNLPFTATDFVSIKAACVQYHIDMLVVGPEDPLVRGIYDFIKQDALLSHIIVVGPSAPASQLEGSKAFSKKFMKRHNIPTAAYEEFDETSFANGLDYLQQHSLPIVLKADGLAAGKGVVICETVEEAKQSFTSMLKEGQFGDAGKKVVVEQFLKGIEVSVFALTDGSAYKIIGHAKDYKRIGEGDTGLNTGGMGCVSPVPFLDEAFMKKVEEKIIAPTINGINKEGLMYKGFVFFGLMKVGDEPYVIEYNCRMGDPETEVVLPRLQNDLVALLASVENGSLSQQQVIISDAACCTVVAVSGGYPGEYAKGHAISGLEPISKTGDLMIFHASTQQAGDEVQTAGGRVLAITAVADNIQSAVAKSLQTLETVQFKDMYFRKDIGYEFKS